MLKRITMTAFCLVLLVLCFSGIAYSTGDAIDEVFSQLQQKYPSLQAIKKQFGEEAKWQRSTKPSPHDPDLELVFNDMVYPGIEIHTLGYSMEDEEKFSVIEVDVKKAGLVDFYGIDIGSNKKDVRSKFGEPQESKGGKLIYHDENEFIYITFVIKNNKVAGMQYQNYPD